MSVQSSSPQFYRNIAILFFVIGGVLVWAAMMNHSWFYWAFAAITLMNAAMSTLKFYQIREKKS
jgi:hypothetical protein